MSTATVRDIDLRPVDEGILTDSLLEDVPSWLKEKRERSVTYGFNPQMWLAMCTNADKGEFQELHHACDEMVEKDCHYASVVNVRDLLLRNLPRSVPPVSDSALDVEVASVCESYLKSPMGTEVIGQLAHAIRKGLLVSELIYSRVNGIVMPTQIEMVDPYALKYERGLPFELGLYTDNSWTTRELPTYKFLVHKQALGWQWFRGGTGRSAGHVMLRKWSAIRDLVAFTEKYGIPILDMQYPPGQEGLKKSLKEAARMFGREMVLIRPTGTLADAKTVVTSANVDLYLDHVDLCNKELSKLELGQTMTTEDGSSLAQSQTHKEQQRMLMDGYGEDFSKTIAEQLFVPIVRLNWGPNVAVPPCVLRSEEQEDLVAFTTSVLPWVEKTQFAIGEKFLREKFRIPELQDGEIAISSKALSGAKAVQEPPLEVQTNSAQGVTWADPLEPAVEHFDDDIHEVGDLVSQAAREAAEQSTNAAEFMTNLDANLIPAMELLRTRAMNAGLIARMIGSYADVNPQDLPPE